MIPTDAMNRAVASERLRLRHGLRHLDAVAESALALGTVGGVERLAAMLTGMQARTSGADATYVMPSEIFIPVALGVATGAMAMIGRGLLTAGAESLEGEILPAAEADAPVLPKKTLEASAGLAAMRALRIEQTRLAHRYRHLRDVIMTAPLIGLLGTVFGVIWSFGGTTGSRQSIFASLTNSLAEALLPAATGLAIGVFAYVLRSSLDRRTEALALEMEIVAQCFH
ncbi:MAG: MotA/TolQ/ExbB proton channel family protein [Bryobacteraceae bacterium]